MNEHNHIVKSYDQEQQALLDELIRMGQMSVAQLEAALDVVERRDDKAAERVIGNDEAIDALEQQVNHDVIRLIRRGPLAGDLRVILAALRVASDIERIGDLAANIAKRSMALNLAPPLPHTRGLDALGRMAARQVRDVLEAYVQRDGEAALRVRASDAVCRIGDQRFGVVLIGAGRPEADVVLKRLQRQWSARAPSCRTRHVLPRRCAASGSVAAHRCCRAPTAVAAGA